MPVIVVALATSSTNNSPAVNCYQKYDVKKFVYAAEFIKFIMIHHKIINFSFILQKYKAVAKRLRLFFAIKSVKTNIIVAKKKK